MPNTNGQYSINSPLIRHLDTNGDGTGTKNAIGNYSAAPTDFFIQPPIGKIFVITTLIFHMSDSGAFSATDYGSIAGGLTNGLTAVVERQAVQIFDLFEGITIQNNDQFLHISPDVNVVNWSGGTDSLVVSYDSQKFGIQLSLNGDLEDKLIVRLNDDMTPLVDQFFIAHGYQ